MYTILCLWLLIFTLIIVLLKLLNINKNYIVSFLITILIILIVMNLQDCIQAALTGLNLVIKTIVPTIFPFSVICNLLIAYDGISLYSKFFGPLICKPLKLSKSTSFPIAASLICGYPLGCKYSAELYSLGYIDKNEFQRLLNIATNASPMFLIGSIGATMLGNPTFGFILLIGNYISPLIVGFLTRFKAKNTITFKEMPTKVSNVNFGNALKSSIENGINTTLQVGAFVIMFSIIISIIKNNAYISIIFTNIESWLNLPQYSLYGFFLGSIEFTNGCKLITTSTLSLTLKLSIISFICSFSGLSVIAQISSFVGNFDISLGKYVFWKFIQGIISFIITFIASTLLIKTTTVSTLIPSPLFINNKLLVFFYVLLLFSFICTLIGRYINKLHTS